MHLYPIGLTNPRLSFRVKKLGFGDGLKKF